VKRFAHSPHYLSAMADTLAGEVQDHFLQHGKPDLPHAPAHPGRPNPERSGMRFPTVAEKDETRNTGE
jgi:hypothetical protein